MNEAKKLKSFEVQGQVASNGSNSRADPDLPNTSRPFVKEENPMKIDLILEVLFDFCPSSTLSNCRLVCKQWRGASLSAWRNKATLCLTHKGMRKLPAILSQRYDVRRELDADSDLQLEKYPFRKFRVDASTLQYIKNDRKPVINIARHIILEDFRRGDPFLSSLHSLESLELRNCEWWRNSAPAPETFVLEKMKRLKFVQSGQSQSLSYDFPGEAILRHFPKLEALSLEYRTLKSCLDNAKTILESADSIRQTESENDIGVSVLALKQLEIINVHPVARQKFDEILIDLIVQCYFPLEKVALDLAFSGKEMNLEKGTRSISHLLKSSKDSIHYLRTCFYFDIDMFIDRVIGIGRCHGEKKKKRKFWRVLKPIPDLNTPIDVLKELKVANGLWGLYLLAHLKLPNLEKLTVQYGHFERKVNILNYQIRLLDLNGIVFPKLESFELLDNQEIPRPETVDVFAKMMPSTLSTLSCPLDKQGFQVVCERFKGLKTLNIQGARCSHALLDDVTLTGISVSKKWAPRPPNITDLANLTDLSISGDAGVFKENSVMYGFLQLPRLYFLSVAFEKISEESKAKLMRHVKGSVQIQDEERLDLNVSESDEDSLTGEISSSSDDGSETLQDFGLFGGAFDNMLQNVVGGF